MAFFTPVSPGYGYFGSGGGNIRDPNVSRNREYDQTDTLVTFSRTAAPVHIIISTGNCLVRVQLALS